MLGENKDKTINGEAFKMERSKYMKMIHAVGSGFYHSKFKLHKGDSKELYKLVIWINWMYHGKQTTGQ